MVTGSTTSVLLAFAVRTPRATFPRTIFMPRLLEGAGPVCGWVSTKLQAAQLHTGDLFACEFPDDT